MFDLSSSVATYSAPDLIAVIVLGVLGGLLGSLYNFFLDKILRSYSVINEYALQTLAVNVFFSNLLCFKQNHCLLMFPCCFCVVSA